MALEERTLRRLSVYATVGYYLCWSSALAVMAWLAAAILWESRAGDTLLRGVDDDWTMIMLPLGAIGGAWAARRTRNARRLQLGCLPVGIGLFVVSLVLALMLFAKSRALSGTGYFAGIGEAIMGLVCAIVAGTGLLIAGIGAAGTMKRAMEQRLTHKIPDPYPEHPAK